MKSVLNSFYHMHLEKKRPSKEATWFINAAGSISSEWASPSKFPDHITTKPIQREP